MAIKFLAGINLEQNELQNATIHNATSDPSGAVVGQMYYNTSNNQLKFYDGSWKVVSTTSGTMSGFTLAGDSGTQAITDGNTVTIAGSAGIDTVAEATDKITISLDLSELTDMTDAVNTSQDELILLDNGAERRKLMSEIFGTAAYSNTGAFATASHTHAFSEITSTPTTISGYGITDGVTSTDVALSLGGNDITIGDSITLAGGLSYNAGTNTLSQTDNNTTYSTATSSTLGLVKIGYTENGKNYPVELSSGQMFVNVPWTDANDDVSEANLKARLAALDSTDTLYIGDSGDDTEVVIRGNLTVDGTTTTVNSETVTIDDNIIVLNSNAADTPTENAGIEVERGASTNVLVRWNESTDRWQFTNNGSTYYNIPTSGEYNNYSHPTFNGDDFSIDTGVLEGATVISDLDINVTTDTNGHVTDANATVSTRNLTLGDLGYTGATNANYYTLPSATTTVTGGVELATNTEAKGGTDTTRAVTAAGVKGAIDDRSKVVIIRGDGTTVDFAVTHSLGTRDVIVQVVDYGNDGTGATYETIMVEVVRNSTSAVTVKFAQAPTTSEDYRVLVTKVV